MSACHIAGLWTYPLKSARGIASRSVRLGATGFEHDREWLIVDAHDRFVTQREQPKLATLTATLSSGGLLLNAAGRPPLQVATTSAATGTRQVRIWNDECLAIDAGDAAARWLSSWLGAGYRLVRFDPAGQRLSNPDWTQGLAAANQFTDGYPILVLSQASLDDLNRRMGRALPVERFRPNLLVDGVPAYAEDGIKELQVGAVVLRLVKPCTRCVITATDQYSGERDGDEPLRTLKTYRLDRQLQGVTFAQNAIIVSGVGETLQVGDECVIR